MKRLLTVLLCVAFLLSCTVSAFAATNSGYFKSPAMTAGKWSGASATYSCYSAAKTATGNNSYTYFRNRKELQSNFVSSNNRKWCVHLYEHDPIGDDLVKVYTGRFDGLKFGYIELTRVEVSGNIEVYGDNCAELYIKAFVDKMSGDPSTPSIASGAFECMVGMN